MLDDVLTLKKIKEGDIESFEKVFRLFYAPLCLFASGITGRTDVAEEVVQDVFYSIWKNREEIQIFRSIKSYLYKAVKNESLQYQAHLEVRRNHRNNLISDQSDIYEPDPLARLEYQELENVIELTLKKLPKRRTQIFHMHRMEGKKYKEIAEQLSISVKTVEAEMTKTYRVLKKEVEKYMYL